MIKKFIVTSSERHAVRYSVEAETEEEAWDQVESGEGGDIISDEIVGLDATHVEEQPKKEI